MGFPRALEKYKEPITGFAGAGTGLFAGELLSEFTARTTGQTGKAKAAVKTAVKGGLGLLFFLIGGSATGQWSLFLKVGAFSQWGSTILDWLFAYYPGGVFGIAERMAVTVRTFAMGAEKIAAELGALERGRAAPTPTRFDGQSSIEITPQRPTPSTIGKYR